MQKPKKRLGTGSLALLLCILGILFTVSTNQGVAIGDTIIRFLGADPWSRGGLFGIHYTVIYSLIFFIPAFLLGNRFNTNIGARLGRNLAVLLMIPGLALLIFIML